MLIQVTWNIDPEIFAIGGFPLRYYSLFFVVAFLLGYKIMVGIFKREGRDEALVNKLMIYVIAGTIIGARLGHTLFYEFGYYKNHPLEIILPFKISNGEFEITGYQGLASHGGAIGILAAVWIFCRKHKLHLLWVLDRLVIVVALGGFFIRLGNFFNSEIIGSPTHLPWAVVFARVDAIPRHPAQLYEALAYIAIFFLLYSWYRKNKYGNKGLLFGWFLLFTFSARLLIEFYKEEQVPFEESLTLNMGQLLSIPFIILGLYFLIRKEAPVNKGDDLTGNDIDKESESAIRS